MPLNKENAKALFAGATDGTTLILPQEQRLGIITEIVDKLLLRELSMQQQPFGENAGGYDFYKVAKSNLSDKTEPGVTLKDKGSWDIVSVKWNTPKHGGRCYMMADIKMGVPDLASFHLLKFADDFKKLTERDGFAKIETDMADSKKGAPSNIETVNNFDNLAGPDLIKKIVTKATLLTQLQDDTDNINLIDRENIVIMVSPDVMDKIALSSMLGNRVDQSFLGGQYSFQTLMGYKIFSCPYLKTWKVMIATNFSLVTAYRMINGKVGKMGNTEDLEIVFEAQSLMGILYPKTIFGIKSNS